MRQLIAFVNALSPHELAKFIHDARRGRIRSIGPNQRQRLIRYAIAQLAGFVGECLPDSIFNAFNSRRIMISVMAARLGNRSREFCDAMLYASTSWNDENGSRDFDAICNGTASRRRWITNPELHQRVVDLYEVANEQLVEVTIAVCRRYSYYVAHHATLTQLCAFRRGDPVQVIAARAELESCANMYHEFYIRF